MGHLQALDVVIIAAYAGLMLYVGWRCSRTAATSEDYFVASRNARPWIVGISMIATMLSSITYMATPGEMIAFGPGMLWGALHGPFTFLIVGYLIIPRIMRRRITSGYELLELKFGGGIRRTASLLFILTRLIWMAFVIYVCTNVISGITQVPVHYLLAAVGVVTIIYTVLGGIRAVMVTDVLQFIILLGGGVLVIYFVTDRCGGLNWWPDWDSPEVASLHWREPPLFSFSLFERVTVLTALLHTTVWWCCTATSDQVMIQRYLCTRDARAARRSFLNCLLADVMIMVLLWTVGFALLGYFLRFGGEAPDPSQSIAEQADALFPHFIATILPVGVRGLIVAALFADAMSSLASGITSVSTVLMIDFGDVFARGTGGEPRAVALRAKKVGVVIGAVAIVSSYLINYVPAENFYTATFRVSGFFIAPMCSLYILAFFVPSSTPAGAAAAIITGFLSGVLFSYWKQIVGSVTATHEFSLVLIMPLSLALSLVVGVLVSLVTKTREELAARTMVEQSSA
jgi:SSS family solute:Na+ symporter